MFELSERCPAEVKSGIACWVPTLLVRPSRFSRVAFRSFVRALDGSLSHPQTLQGTNGKYFDLKLHTRIEIFSKRQSSAGEKLMALKMALEIRVVIRGMLVRNDLLDGLKYLKYLLAELFEKTYSPCRQDWLGKLMKKHAKRRK